MSQVPQPVSGRARMGCPGSLSSKSGVMCPPGSQSPREWELLTPGNLAKGEKRLRWSDMTTPSLQNSSLAGLPFFLFLFSPPGQLHGNQKSYKCPRRLPWGADGSGVGAPELLGCMLLGSPCRSSLWWDLVSVPSRPNVEFIAWDSQKKRELEQTEYYRSVALRVWFCFYFSGKFSFNRKYTHNKKSTQESIL